MPTLEWDDDFDRTYEEGVDRGALYLEGVPGVAWKGLVSVKEQAVGGERNPFYYDGVKYAEIVSGRNYQATVEGFAAPKEFAECLGRPSPKPGLYLTRQSRKRFNFTYRTMIDDVGYKIHFVYNVLATPMKSGHVTLGTTVTPSIFGWRFDAVPPPSRSFKPSAHLIVDSTKINQVKLQLLEDTLYGTEITDPEMPAQPDVISLIRDDVISEPLSTLI